MSCDWYKFGMKKINSLIMALKKAFVIAKTPSQMPTKKDKKLTLVD